MDEADSAPAFSPEETRKFEQRQARRDAASQRMDGLRDEARAAIDRSGPLPARRGKGDGSKVTVERRPLPGRPPTQRDVHKELVKARGDKAGDRAWTLFKRAAKEFEREQYNDARKTMKPLVEANKTIAELHELYGLCLYRLGQWDDAIESLETFRLMSGTAEQHPVLMDSHRALGNWADVDELWNELGEASPAAELMIEGRIVRSGAEADRGDISSAVRVLEKGWKPPKKPMEHHLRRAYALADLYERAGKVPRSRALFEWIDTVAPHFGDVPDRIRSLG